MSFDFSLAGILYKVIEFFIVYVLIRTYIRRDIEVELAKKGLFQDGFFHAVVHKARRYRQIWISEWQSVKSTR